MIRRPGFLSTETICWFCKEPAPDSVFRTPIVGVIGGRYVVCSPQCPDRPDDTLVFAVEAK